jgi:hypothetical protein
MVWQSQHGARFCPPMVKARNHGWIQTSRIQTSRPLHSGARLNIVPKIQRPHKKKPSRSHPGLLSGPKLQPMK